jgi:hypothetical protein
MSGGKPTLGGLTRLAQGANAEPVGEPRQRASAMTAAVVKVRKLTATAYARRGADPEEHDIERAWDMIEAAPHEIEADRLRSRAFVKDNGLDEDDPNALVVVEATHDLARDLRTVLIELRETFPKPDPLEELRRRARPVDNLDDAMRLAPKDTTDHLARIEEAEKRAVAIAAAAVRARKLIEAAQEKDAPGFAYDVQDLAWTLIEKTPEEIDDAEEEARAELEDPDDEDALAAVHATFNLGRGLRTLVIELRDSFPEPDPLEALTERLDEAETVTDAEERAKRIASRFETARTLRALLGTYGRKVVEHLAAWPEGERDEEEEALRSVVFGEDSW